MGWSQGTEGPPTIDRNRNTMMRRRIILGALAVVWASLVVIIVIITWKHLATPLPGEPDTRPEAVAISVVPGVLLFGYVMARPRRSNISILLVALAVGLLVHGFNSRYVPSKSCREDAMCGINLLLPPGAEVLVFSALSARNSTRAGRLPKDQ